MDFAFQYGINKVPQKLERYSFFNKNIPIHFKYDLILSHKTKEVDNFIAVDFFRHSFGPGEIIGFHKKKIGASP